MLVGADTGMRNARRGPETDRVRRRFRVWVVRYLPAELAGTLAALAAAWSAEVASGAMGSVAVAGVVGENLGYAPTAHAGTLWPIRSCLVVRRPGPGGRELNPAQGVLPQQQVDQHGQHRRGNDREQHHEQAAESATERADLQVPEAHAERLTADANRKPSRRRVLWTGHQTQYLEA
jgi:hypothetical protein